MITGRAWSPEDLQYLRDYYPIKTNAVLMEEMSRSDCALRTKADRLGIQKHYDWKINKVDLTPSPSLSYLIGVSFGDGSPNMTRRKTGRTNYNIDLFVTDEDFADAFNEALYQVLGRRYAVTPYGNRYQVRGQSKVLYLLLKDRDLESLRKFIDPFPADFVRGFADSEGNAYAYQNANCPWLKISMGCTNQAVIEYTSDLLRLMDIRSKVTPKKPGLSVKNDGSIIVSKKMMYVLNIHDKASMKRYSDQIGFSIARKQNVLLAYWQQHPTWRKSPIRDLPVVEAV